METLKEIEERHDDELQRLHEACPHNEVDILEGTRRFNRNKGYRYITLRCKLCGVSIFRWRGDAKKGRIIFARGFNEQSNQG